MRISYQNFDRWFSISTCLVFIKIVIRVFSNFYMFSIYQNCDKFLAISICRIVIRILLKIQRILSVRNISVFDYLYHKFENFKIRFDFFWNKAAKTQLMLMCRQGTCIYHCHFHPIWTIMEPE